MDVPPLKPSDTIGRGLTEASRFGLPSLQRLESNSTFEVTTPCFPATGQSGSWLGRCKVPDQRCVTCPKIAKCGHVMSTHVPKMFPLRVSEGGGQLALGRVSPDQNGWRRWDSNPRPPACKVDRGERGRTTWRVWPNQWRLWRRMNVHERGRMFPNCSHIRIRISSAVVSKSGPPRLTLPYVAGVHCA
jgi:hypothetical protein